jgi:GNAT superfamily N-acetyltransferase
MYKWEKLKKRKLKYLVQLNETRNSFNALNEDFFSIYTEAGFTEQIYLRNQVKLLKCNEDYIGYLWARKCKKRHYQILSFNVSQDFNIAMCENNCLSKAFKPKTKLEYRCEKNNYNFTQLEQLGFKIDEGVVEMIKPITSDSALVLPSEISFESFLRGIHEEKRCSLQNEIFKSNNREPLAIEDIYYDVIQEYFWDKGSIFIKYKDTYIGYGQVILDDNSPTIVNFGILSEFRFRGYGQLLLTYLINLLHRNGYKAVKLKVNPDNTKAYGLYLKMGFIKKREYYNWILDL